MKILFITGTFPQLTFIFRTVTAIAQRGHEVIVMARDKGNWQLFADELPLDPRITVKYMAPDIELRRPDRFKRFVYELGKTIMLSPRGTLRLLRMCFSHPATRDEPLRQFLRHLALANMSNNDIDVVQFEFYIMTSMYPLLDDLVGAPIVVSCRGSDVNFIKLNNSEVQRARRQCLESATAIHCVSSNMARKVAEFSGRTDDLWVNHPAVNARLILWKEDYQAKTIPTIITSGRLYWVKGLDYLLASLYRLKQEGIPFRAQIIGDGEMYAQMRFSIEDLGLREEVELVGSLPPSVVLERLREADIFVLPSHEEGLANAVLEAMAAGLPIVTTNAGGMDEAVRDGVDGYVVPVRDIRAMTQRIKELLADPVLRERMGRAGRARVVAEFTVERQALVFEEIYQAVTGIVVVTPVEQTGSEKNAHVS
jgi:colanic acid/amylovoran biosynthesis glycosyltransferase